MHGQKDLFVVLKCISILDPEIGYVQGLGYMVAILLTYLDKEDALNIMLQIVNSSRFRMRQFYLPGFPMLRKTFYVHLSLLRKHMSKLFYHLLENFMSPILYATQWFMTLFSNNIPLPLTLRIWDIFFVEGFWVLHSVALAILKINEK